MTRLRAVVEWVERPIPYPRWFVAALGGLAAFGVADQLVGRLVFVGLVLVGWGVQERARRRLVERELARVETHPHG